MARDLAVRLVVVAGVVMALGATSPTARADSTPVGRLPAPVVTTVSTTRGSLVTVSLRARPAATGLVWRIARSYDSRIVRQVREAEIGGTVVIVFQTLRAGRTRIVVALTRGDASPKAIAAVRYDVTVT